MIILSLDLSYFWEEEVTFKCEKSFSSIPSEFFTVSDLSHNYTCDHIFSFFHYFPQKQLGFANVLGGHLNVYLKRFEVFVQFIGP